MKTLWLVLTFGQTFEGLRLVLNVKIRIRLRLILELKEIVTYQLVD